MRSTCFTYSPPVAYQKVMRFNPTLAGNKGFQGCFGFMGLFGIDQTEPVADPVHMCVYS